MTADPRFDGPGPDQMWRDHLARGEISMQCCAACNRFRFPPSIACTHCGSPTGEWKPVSGRAQVYASTTVRERDGAYNVSIVELAEGPRMMSRVDGIAAEAVAVGMSVTASITGGDDPHLVFQPLEAAR